jgi:cobalt transporter subunit CbtB
MNHHPVAEKHSFTAEAAPLAARVASAITALSLGVFLLLGAGFAPISAIHNAAHDARHAFAFPCH